MKELDALLPQLEQQHGLAPGLLRAVMMTESAGNVRAVSPKGAAGLFQFMPATAREYGIDPFNPQQSAEAAARKLAGLAKRYGGDTTKALQAYNWGEGNMASGKPMPAETRAYAGKVFASMPKQQDKIDASKVQWDAEPIDVAKVQWDDAPKAAPGKTFAQQAKQFGADVLGGAVRGAASIGATLTTPVTRFDRKTGAPDARGFLDKRRDTLREVDAGLTSAIGSNAESMPYAGGKLAAEVAGTLGVGGALAQGARGLGASPAVVSALQSSGFTTGAAPATRMARAADLALRTGAGATTGAASAALVAPESTATGAAIGGLLPGATKVVGAVARGAGRMLGPNVADPALAQKAIQQYGIPLGPADISGSNMTKAVRSVLNDAPLTGGIGAKQREAVQGGFNRAVGRTFGADSTSLTPKVIDQAKARMGGEFDRLWNQNVVQVDGDLFNSMQAMRANAAKLPQGEAARVSSWLDDIEAKMVPDANGELRIPGDVANRLQSKLRQDAEKATGFLKSELMDMRKALIGAFNRSVSPDDAAALSMNMRQYKAFKTVQPLLEGAEAGVAGRELGDIPAAMLPQAVRKSYGSNIANSPFADLSQIGSQYVADRVARTGGSSRAMIQNSAIGAALGMGGLSNPLLAAGVIPAGMATNALLGSPALAARMAAAQPFNALMLPPELQVQLFRAAPATAPAFISGQ